MGESNLSSGLFRTGESSLFKANNSENTDGIEEVIISTKVVIKVPRINTYNLDMNCYYVCAAFLKNMTVEELINKTELMQENCATLQEIKDLFKAAELYPYDPTSFNNIDGVEAFIENSSEGFDNDFALAYVTPPAPGHMVIVHYDATEQRIEYKDYQQDDQGAMVDPSNSGNYFLFGPYRRNDD